MEPESRAIESAQELFQDKEIPDQLALIKANFQVLANSITALEERLPLAQSVRIVEQVDASMQLEPFSTKFSEVLGKNPGFKEISSIAKILSGEPVEKEERARLPMDPAILANFACAPITSVDVERFFSSMKDLLSCKRLSMTETHIRDQMIVQWNREIA